jgi:hypothetical protein
MGFESLVTEEDIERANKADEPLKDFEKRDFDPRTDYYNNADWSKHAHTQVTPPPEAPKVPNEGGGKSGKDGVAVSTEALRTFAKNIVMLRDAVVASSKYVKEVDIRPGAFGGAFQLKKDIQGSGSGGLRDDTYKYMTQVVVASLEQLEKDILKLAIDYDSTEELNKLEAEKLTNLLRVTFATIDADSKYGGAESGQSGDGSDSGGSGSGSGGSEST